MRQWLMGLALLALAFTGCTQATDDNEGGLRIVVTTSIAGDVVKQVVGDTQPITVLMAPGQDPHSYEATAQALQQVERADLVFINGFHFEEALVGQVESIATGRVVTLSEGIEPLHGADHAHEGEEAAHEGEEDDPHVWWDIHNVEQWVTNAANALAEADPASGERYHANAAAYVAELRALDAEVRIELDTIPPERRQLVTTHGTLAYFARAYGFEVVGTVLPGFSTGTEPTASELSALKAQMEAAGVHALFTENTVSDALSRVVAQESGATIYPLYTDALGPPGSGAESYVGFMRTNVQIIVGALR